VVHRLHGIEGVPPCTGGTQQLLRCKAHLHVLSDVEKQELLLHDMKPVLRV
jgi:hypothetical protein